MTLALARRLLPRQKAAAAVAWSAGAFGLGTIAGFVVGGLLAQYASWRWIFVVGAVLVTAGCAAVLVLVPATEDRAQGRYDWRGTIALGAAAIILLASYPVITSGTPQFTAFTLAYLVAAGLCVAGALLMTVLGRSGNS